MSGKVPFPAVRGGNGFKLIYDLTAIELHFMIGLDNLKIAVRLTKLQIKCLTKLWQCLMLNGARLVHNL